MAQRLKDWIDSFPKEKRSQVREELAHKLGISLAMVKHMISGRRQIAGKHVLTIEAFTNAAVTKHDMRPDIFGEQPRGLCDVCGGRGE